MLRDEQGGMIQRRVLLSFLLFLTLLLAACRDDAPLSPTPTTAAVAQPEASSASQDSSAAVSVPTATATAIPPTATPTEPLAAMVNDQPILMSEYERELARYEQAQAELGRSEISSENPDYRTLVLDALVERVLIAQAAEAQQLAVTPQMIEEKLAELQAAAGDPGNFEAWLKANQWTEDEFREALAAEMLTESVVSAVTADVPYAVEQVRARYLQVDDPALAQSLLDQAAAGADFATLSEQNSLDRVTAPSGGDLGFFARGSLLVPAVEEAAFTLEPGQVSEIITHTDVNSGQATYYLVQLIERDPNRSLTADLRYKLLQQAFETWLDAQWNQATIIRFIDTDV